MGRWYTTSQTQGPPGPGVGHRFLARLVDPANLVTLPVAAVFCLLRPLGLITHLPYWAIIAVLLGADLVHTLVVALIPDTPPGWRRSLRVAIEMGVIALVIYGIGWGPLLAVGFVFGAADSMRQNGARVSTQSIGWALVFMAAGQGAIATGLAPTLVRQPLVHGLAVLSALGVVVTIKVLEWFAVVREESEERFKTLVEHASDIVVVVDADGHFTYVSPSFTRTLGWATSQFERLLPEQLLHPDDLAGLRAQVEDSAGVFDPDGSVELRLQHVDGSWHWFESTVVDHRQDPYIRGFVANLHDVTARRTLEDELRHQAFHDPLTKLANRDLFADRLDHALARQGRSREPLAVVLVDLDDFKAINDSLGHGVGDCLLAETAARLLSVVRASDTVARLGGDEFAILLEDPMPGGGPEQVAERLIEEFSMPVMFEGRSFVLSASVGVVLAEEPGMSVQELIRNADVAMYAAKARGKGRAATFHPEMHEAIQRRLEVKTDLLEAVAAGDQMALHYQPVVDLDTREIVGVEALLRWNHPRAGSVPPLEFLPVAEDSGLVVPLGSWVLREAATQVAAWRRRHPHLDGLTVSVNVSGRQLEDPGFVAAVVEVLADTALDPGALVIEITESTLMREAGVMSAKLAGLKAMGVGVAVDDFGTGYSSLSYLKDFPIDVLKVDRSFVAGMSAHPRQAALTEAVVRMAETLGIRAVGEGVEYEEQARRLREFGCHQAQGYVFSRPLPATECEELLVVGGGRLVTKDSAGPWPQRLFERI